MNNDNAQQTVNEGKVSGVTEEKTDDSLCLSHGESTEDDAENGFRFQKQKRKRKRRTTPPREAITKSTKSGTDATDVTTTEATATDVTATDFIKDSTTTTSTENDTKTCSVKDTRSSSKKSNVLTKEVISLNVTDSLSKFNVNPSVCKSNKPTSSDISTTVAITTPDIASPTTLKPTVTPLSTNTTSVNTAPIVAIGKSTDTNETTATTTTESSENKVW